MSVISMSATENPTNTNSAAAADAATIRRNQMLAIAMLVVCIFAGAGFGFWRWQSNRLPDEPLVDAPAGGRGFMAGGPQVRMQEPPRDGVRKVAKNFQIRVGQAVMTAVPEGAEWRFTYRYQPGKFSSPDQTAFLAAKYQSMSLGLTEEQKKQLNELPAWVGGMVVSPDDQKTLEGLWSAYVAAPNGDKPKQEQALVDALKDVAARSEQPTLAAVDAHVGKIQAILTPEQIAKLKQKK